jgi:hypothetical protein
MNGSQKLGHAGMFARKRGHGSEVKDTVIARPALDLIGC